jgi:hypothetical protein
MRSRDFVSGSDRSHRRGDGLVGDDVRRVTIMPRISHECWRTVDALLAAAGRAPNADEKRRLFNQAEDLLRLAAAQPDERERVLKQAAHLEQSPVPRDE